MSRELPSGYLELLPVWDALATKLQITYISLGVTATACSLIAATFTSELGTAWVKVVSFMAALALALITAFNLGGKANAARDAWRLLNAAVLAYQGDSNYTIQELHQQYLAGEKLIGPIDYTAPSEKPKKPE